MISVEEGLQKVLKVSERPPPVSVSINEALGKVMAEDIDAPDPLPPYPTSIKDGYTVVVSDGPVVQVENTEPLIGSSSESKRIQIMVNATKRLDIRPVGCGIEKGSVVLKSGDHIGASEIGLLATVGVNMVKLN